MNLEQAYQILIITIDMIPSQAKIANQ